MRKKTYALLGALLLVIGLLSVAVAYLWITRVTQFSFKVKANGDFRVYLDEECTSEFTSLWDFGEIEADGLPNLYFFYIENKGNIPLNLTWDLTSGSEGWEYFHDANKKYKFVNSYGEISSALVLKQMTPTEIHWQPTPYNETVDTKILLLDHYEIKTIKLVLYVVPTAICETIDFELTFYGNSTIAP